MEGDAGVIPGVDDDSWWIVPLNWQMFGLFDWRSRPETWVDKIHDFTWG